MRARFCRYFRQIGKISFLTYALKTWIRALILMWDCIYLLYEVVFNVEKPHLPLLDSILPRGVERQPKQIWSWQ